MKQPVGECPDMELIAAYLDNRLGQRERARVTEHLGSCEECYFVFREAAQTHVDDRLGQSRGRAPRAWLAMPIVACASAGAALAAAAAVCLTVGTGIVTWRPADRELQALVAAVGTTRPIEARLTGGFAYGPLHGVMRGASMLTPLPPAPQNGGAPYGPLRVTTTPVPPTVMPEVIIAATRGEKRLAALGTPAALHALGVAGIVVFDLDRAIPMIERAVNQPSPDPKFLNDLAAAYLARAARDSQHQDLVKALAAADRAVNADATLAEALFNRALALERLSLVDEARAAWQEYLRVDENSGWADEAREHLRGLQ
jgi:tetratricopeptide (TPR) repeat protein